MPGVTGWVAVAWGAQQDGLSELRLSFFCFASPANVAFGADYPSHSYETCLNDASFFSTPCISYPQIAIAKGHHEFEGPAMSAAIAYSETHPPHPPVKESECSEDIPQN